MPGTPRVALSALLAAAAALSACAGGSRAHRPPTAPAQGSGAAYSQGAARPAPAPAPMPTVSYPAAGGIWGARDVTIEQAIEGGRATGKPVALWFLASWCGYCQRLEANTISNPAVQQEMSRYYNVRINPDSPTGRALATRYSVSGFPNILLIDGRGGVVGTLVGYREPVDMCSRLRSGR